MAKQRRNKGVALFPVGDVLPTEKQACTVQGNSACHYSLTGLTGEEYRNVVDGLGCVYSGPVDLSNPESVPVGTKVRIINAEYFRHKLGKSYVIVKVDTRSDSMSYKVGGASSEDRGVWYNNSSLELQTNVSSLDDLTDESEHERIANETIIEGSCLYGIKCSECPLNSDGDYSCQDFKSSSVDAAKAYLADINSDINYAFDYKGIKYLSMKGEGYQSDCGNCCRHDGECLGHPCGTSYFKLATDAEYTKYKKD